MMQPLRVFIGYDSREPVAYHVAAHSILARASEPIAVIPLRMDTLRQQGYYWRGQDEKAATEFSLTRFLVPALCGYEGWAVFMDCDVLVRVDLAGELRRAVLGDPDKAVWVAKHDYVPRAQLKMDGQVQHAYPRKNWSSVMVFENARCAALTPEYVNKATPAQLHRFAWLRDDEIGALSTEWNWLVGEYDPNPAAKILHYTLGGPWFRETRYCDHADLWWDEFSAMKSPTVEHGHIEQLSPFHDRIAHGGAVAPAPIAVPYTPPAPLVAGGGTPPLLSTP